MYAMMRVFCIEENRSAVSLPQTYQYLTSFTMTPHSDQIFIRDPVHYILSSILRQLSSCYNEFVNINEEDLQ